MVSQSPKPPKFKFGSAIQRDDSFLEVGKDPNIYVCPARYDEKKFLAPDSSHISLEKSLKFKKDEKKLDFRRVGRLHIVSDHTFIL